MAQVQLLLVHLSAPPPPCPILALSDRGEMGPCSLSSAPIALETSSSSSASSTYLRCTLSGSVFVVVQEVVVGPLAAPSHAREHQLPQFSSLRAQTRFIRFSFPPYIHLHSRLARFRPRSKVGGRPVGSVDILPKPPAVTCAAVSAPPRSVLLQSL